MSERSTTEYNNTYNITTAILNITPRKVKNTQGFPEIIIINI